MFISFLLALAGVDLGEVVEGALEEDLGAVHTAKLRCSLDSVHQYAKTKVKREFGRSSVGSLLNDIWVE